MIEWLTEMGASQTWGAEADSVNPRPVATHAYGGTRAGDDPDSGFSHEAPNLGVLGASTFPCVGGRNPTETVYATAWRTADHLAKNWNTIAA